MRFHWITVVWGKLYTEFFTEIVLPSQLSAENLPALKHRNESDYKIYAPDAEIDSIRRSPMFSRLVSSISVQFIEIAAADEALLKAWPYDFMTRCHRHAYDSAVAAEAAAVFLAPDAILSDGSFTALERRALEGYSLLLTSTLQVAIEGGRPWIEHRCREPDGSIRLTSQQAAEMMRECPQSLTEHLIVSGPKFANDWPAYLWMPVNQSSMVFRAWHLHPIIVKNVNSTISVDTIDSGQFLEDATARGELIHVFKDSRELCVVELSTYRQRAGHHEELMPFSIEKVAKWVGAHTGTANRALARQSFLFDGGDASPDAVAQADQVLSEYVDAVLSRCVSPIQSAQPICSTSEIDRTRRTYFYGSGAIGQTLLEEMDSLRPWHFQGFIDSRQSGSCRGFPVLDLEQFQSA